MKKYLKVALTATLFLSAITATAADAPSLMVLPDNTWCNVNGYGSEINRGGKTRFVPDYDKAFLNEEFTQVNAGVSQVFAQRGFPLKNAMAQNEADDFDEMLDDATEGAESGAGVATNSYDQLVSKLGPDITLKIGWTLNRVGFNYSVSYRLTAVDAYSNKDIASVAHEGGAVPRSTPLSAAISDAMQSNMDEFCNQLMSSFMDTKTNGREIRCSVNILDNGDDITMNTEYGGEELGNLIAAWVGQNTLNHNDQPRSRARTRMQFAGLRIPFDMDANKFATNLQKYLKSLGIVAENKSAGKGNARLTIGEK